MKIWRRNAFSHINDPLSMYVPLPWRATRYDSRRLTFLANFEDLSSIHCVMLPNIFSTQAHRCASM